MAMYLKSSLALGLLSLVLLQAAGPAAAQDTILTRKEMTTLNWLMGPTSVAITDRAEITLPAGYTALSAIDTARLMQLIQASSGGEEYYVGPEDKSWYVVFSYQDIGHVPDNERLDPDALVASLRANEAAANAESQRRGLSELRFRGWRYQPFYDATRNRLTWAVESESDGAVVVNYHARILGRTGVMSAAMTVDSGQVDFAVKQVQELLEGYRFLPGQTYADFRPGERAAEHGLAFLIAGEAAPPVAEPDSDTDTGSRTAIATAIIVALLVLGGLAGWFLGGRR